MKKGRWQLERERHKIVREYPLLGVKEPTHIGKVICPVVKAIENAYDNAMTEVEKKWEMLIGKEASAHCRPGRFEHNRLTIFVDSSVWVSEMERYGKRKLLQQLQQLLGKDKITKIIFRLDPGNRPGKK